MKILVTGAAGFIGYSVCKALLERGDTVIGVDNLNDYYDVQLKKDRLQLLKNHINFCFLSLDLTAGNELSALFSREKLTHVIHLAAQAGVRYSLENPKAYIDNNIIGTFNVLESCRHFPVEHLIYASSSSVYGLNSKVPFSVMDPVDQPASLYAATKRSNELMAYTYSHLFSIPATGLRFFTVYGPWGRPDMAPMKFAHAIFNDQAIDVYNFGHMRRDFTYIDDIVTDVINVLDKSPKSSNLSVPHRIYNIGNSQPIPLIDFILTLEKSIGKQAKKNWLPLQPGDVIQTYADIDDLCADFNFKPIVGLTEGITRFVAWYKEYYKINSESLSQAS